MTDLSCPRCKLEFEAEEWHNGQCPGCQNGYTWDEQCTEDYSDCWSFVEWDHYD